MISTDERLELEQVHQQLKAMRQVVDGLEKSLAPLWHKLFEMEKEVQDRLMDLPYQGEHGLEGDDLMSGCDEYGSLG
jgi:hypothetical protein